MEGDVARDEFLENKAGDAALGHWAVVLGKVSSSFFDEESSYERMNIIDGGSATS